MKWHVLILWMLASLTLTGGCAISGMNGVVSGELEQWHAVTLSFAGPEASEFGRPNPFLDYRMTITFIKDQARYVVPGYYAADGNAGQTGAAAGYVWRACFLPPEPGRWTYVASFEMGWNIAVDPNVEGTPLAFHGQKGSFEVGPTDKTGRDFRAQGLLRYVGQRYLQFAQTKSYFLKGGADSPENFLAYADFDGTYDTGGLTRPGEAAGGKFLHHYQPHVQDWQQGDPTWKNGKGKGIIGALNYLASKGMNSVYFLTYNVDGGDGKDVWPWVDPNDKRHFDCSKLDQWEIVFSHMDRLGLMLHVVMQETENDQALDKGELGLLRKLYYRELIARFAHHPALVWNLGEENSNTDAQRKAFCAYIHSLDPYDHPIVCHTFPGKYDEVYEPLLGYKALVRLPRRDRPVAHGRQAGQRRLLARSGAIQASLGQPDGRRRRGRVVLRLPLRAQRPQLRELAQPRPHVGHDAVCTGVLPELPAVHEDEPPRRTDQRPGRLLSGRPRPHLCDLSALRRHDGPGAGPPGADVPDPLVQSPAGRPDGDGHAVYSHGTRQNQRRPAPAGYG
jgi:hypothetical protein